MAATWLRKYQPVSESPHNPQKQEGEGGVLVSLHNFPFIIEKTFLSLPSSLLGWD